MSDEKNDTLEMEEKQLEELSEEERALLNKKLDEIMNVPFPDGVNELLTNLYEKLDDKNFLKELMAKILRDEGA